MVLADLTVFLCGGGLLVLGIVGFFAVMLAAVVRVFRWIVGSETREESGSLAVVPQMCDNPQCGHANRPDARFCARCGRRLRTSIAEG